jgi:anti-sigma B factor antagonist
MTRTEDYSAGADFARLEYVADGPAGAHLRLALQGEVDLAERELLDGALEKVMTVPPCDVTVDLSAVTFLSSTGLSLIASINNHVTSSGHTVTLANPAPIVLRILQVCGFDQVIPVTGTERREAVG